MKPSTFNLRAPLQSGDVFLMNTLSDAQVIVSADVVSLLDRLDAPGAEPAAWNSDERDAIGTLAGQGFVVKDDASERAALESHFASFRDDASQLRVTILTTLRCNFACEYCYQGDHGGQAAARDVMPVETAARVAAWINREVDMVRPRRLVITFFGGEPLLNVPAMMVVANACAAHARSCGVEPLLNIITNGLLLTPAIVDALLPLGLNGVKVTLDGDRETHDRVRPLRGGQGTFDRIIENVRRVADRVPVAIGGNFDMSTADRYPALLDILKSQPFANRISTVAFKPVIAPAAGAAPAGAVAGGRRVIPLADASAAPPHAARGNACAGGGGTGSVCDNCHFVDDQLSFLREETKRRGFDTPDGVHMGPCELYRRHSHTIGPDGSQYACPGFTGENALAIGHIDRRADAALTTVARRVEHLAPWRQCGDCSFIPVCGGGCAVASHAELGDMGAPSCHKRSFEAALVSLADETAGSMEGGIE
jgi:uncharacterized protein